jgi:hypothetical protein
MNRRNKTMMSCCFFFASDKMVSSSFHQNEEHHHQSCLAGDKNEMHLRQDASVLANLYKLLAMKALKDESKGM